VRLWLGKTPATTKQFRKPPMKFFCECIKDAGVKSVHSVTAIGNATRDRKRREANTTMSRATQAVSTKDPDSYALDEEDPPDIVHGSKAWSIPLDIKKAEPDKQLIFGWASVVEKDGVAIIDKQGDVIAVDDLENAAYVYVMESRTHGDMHNATYMAKMVESMVFTKEKQEALGIDLGQVGWWVGFKVDNPELWDAHKRGERPEFSIGGAAVPVDLVEKKGGGRRWSRHPFESGAASTAHHVLSRMLAHQQHKLLHEYSSNSMVKASDNKVDRIVRVVDQDDIVLQNATNRLVETLTRAAQRTGSKAAESMVGNPKGLLRPEEQARLRAMHNTLSENVDFWAKKYGKGRAAELVGRMYDKSGKLVVNQNAEWNINATTNEVATRLVTEALENNWNVGKLSDALTASKLFTPDRAEMIARTEISRAQNLAMLRAGYEYNRLARKNHKKRVRKIWLLGPNPCPICEENGGEVLTLGREYSSGDFAPPVHPNCMCELELIEE